ncbi:MAG: PhoH family protein [Phycisphaeraceae bacterium]|nr:PhoH family protein [Phycisphaeraceae bacterium]
MELTIKLPEGAERYGVTGPAERNLKIIREALGVTINARSEALKLTGKSDAVGQAAHVIERLNEAARHDSPFTRQQLLDAIAAVNTPGSFNPAFDSNGDAAAPHAGPIGHGFDVYLEGRRVKPMSPGQRGYVDCIANNDLTFCIGPAGTGKTYLAVAAAVSMLKRGQVRKLVLVRPAVEAGEKLGFLPGTMQDKVNPYLRPLLDALHDMMPFEQIERFMAVDLIEIVPLAFMRGRTLNDACIICDEAQNTTKSQMLMFLTRLGHGSKMIVTGDTSQIDLDDPRDSGLIDAVRRLRRTRGIAMCTLDGADIVRHSLVQRVVEAYGQQDNRPQTEFIQDVIDDMDASENDGPSDG